MRRRDDGAALVEFTWLAVLLMVPLAYVLLSAFAVQRASFGVTEAARQAGRAYVRAADPASGLSDARRAGGIALSDQGVSADGLVVDDPTALAPGGRVTVTVTSTVRLPVLGVLLPGDLAPRIPVSATHVEVVDAFRAAR